MSKTKAKSVIAEFRIKLLELFEGSRWTSIDEMFAEAERRGLFTEEFKEAVVVSALKETMRKAMRRKDPTGFPLFPNLIIKDAKTGEKRRVYMREKYMRPVHYQQLGVYWEKSETHAHRMRKETYTRCDRRYHTQLLMAFMPEEASTPQV